jgi:hypothetical protein
MSDNDEVFSDFSSGSSGNYIPDEAEASSSSEVRNLLTYSLALWSMENFGLLGEKLI